MKQFFFLLMGLLCPFSALLAQTSDACRPEVVLTTDMGDIRVRLYNETPLHRDNFLKNVREGNYDGILFHRVIKDFMIQSGDTASRHAEPGQLLGDTPEPYTVPAEFRTPRYFHKKGALAAARENDDVNPERASSAFQFYLVYGHKYSDAQLDKTLERISQATGQEATFSPLQREVYKRKGGAAHLDGQYTVFGEIVEGLDIVEKIQSVETDDNDRPLQNIAIRRAYVAPESEGVVISNPLPVRFGDPFLLHAADGRYYLYGTSLGDGFECFVSDDLRNWDPCGQIYKGGQSGQWNKDCFWAPEVYERNGKYYLFYSANLSDEQNINHDLETFSIGVAVSDSPMGPFTDLYNHPLLRTEYPVIDADVWFDDATGKCYLYYSRCCYKHAVKSEIATKMKKQKQQYQTVEGNPKEIEESWVYGVELKPDFSGVIGEPQLLLCPPAKLDDKQAEWESRSVTSGEVNRRWTEGSFIFKEGDTYYIMYSANFYGGPYYAVGYATSQSPFGPFQKADNNPVLEKNVEQGGIVTGTGHNMVITIDGQRYIVYHAYTTADPRHRVVMMDKLNVANGKIEKVEVTTK